MKRIALSSLLAALALTVASAAYAGARQTNNVIVTQGQSGQGAMGSARNSTDANQYIGCMNYQYSGGSEYVFCVAVDSAKNSVSCYSTDAGIVSIAHSLAGDSF